MVTSAPWEYTDMILIPHILHIDPPTFWSYPPAMQQMMRELLRKLIGAGWAGKPESIDRG